jgi:hypothetical protein
MKNSEVAVIKLLGVLEILGEVREGVKSRAAAGSHDQERLYEKIMKIAIRKASERGNCE